MTLTADQRDAELAEDHIMMIRNAMDSGKLSTEQLPTMIARLQAGEGKALTPQARQIVIERLQAMLQAPAPAPACRYCNKPSLAGGELCQAHQTMADALAAKSTQLDAPVAKPAALREKNTQMRQSFFKPQVSGDISKAVAMRRAGEWQPDGQIDSYGYWYPSEREECPECAHVLSPWATLKSKYLIHCQSSFHIGQSMLCGDEWM